MIARVWTWLRSAGSWVLALVVAVPLIAWAWRLYRAERAGRLIAEARARVAERAADATMKAAGAREKASAALKTQLAEMHAAYERDRAALVRIRRELEAVQTPAWVAAAFDRAYGPQPPDDPVAVAPWLASQSDVLAEDWAIVE